VPYVLDKSHTEIGFAVRHLGLMSVKGYFTEFTGSLDIEGGTLKGMSADIDVASVHTRDTQRDNHLRSADFFHAEAHPKMHFQSTQVEPQSGNTYRVTGDLTIRGNAKPVTLTVELGEEIKDPWGNQRVSFTARGELDRREWGLTWNAVVEAGRFVVGDKVQLNIEGEAVRQ
jgi:polyisoprenoid-binding protein YceI